MTTGRHNGAEPIVITATGRDVTAEIQAAIEKANALGGGRVRLASGPHMAGGLRLLSGVELNLAAGAVLHAAPGYDAYAATTVSVIAENSDRAMIVASDAENVALTGPGRIEAGGQGYIIGDDASVGTYIPAGLRPRVLVLERCRNVRITGIEVARSPMWTLHLVDCEDIAIRDVTIDNDRRLPNTDGIVLDACRRAVVEDCHISTADDGICLKTSAGPDGKAVGRCEDVLVRRSTVSSLSCALKLGTESYGDFLNVTFEDCRVVDSNRALGLFSRDGGHMRNIRFSRIAVDCRETPDGFWGSGEALTVTVVDRRPQRRAGDVENLVVEDITGRMEGAINLITRSEAAIRRVALRRVSLRQLPGKLCTGRTYDLRPTQADLAPDAGAEGRANAWTRGADGGIVGLEPYPGGMPVVYLEGVDDVEIEGVDVTRPAELPPGWNPNTIVTAAKR